MTDKPTVLLLHGNPTWSFLYRKVIPTLCNSGHRVIALDWIGLGRSDKLKERADYDIELHITSLVAFVEGLQLSNVAVVGQDWGGAVALLSLSRFKPGTITGLCIVDSFVPSATLQDKSFNELLLYGIWLLSTTLFQRLVSVPLTIKFLGPSIPLTALIGYNAPFPSFAYKSGMLQWASLIALPYTSSPTVQRDAPVAILPGLANIMSRATKMSLLVHKFREAAKTFKHPVLVVYGQNDELFGDTLDTFLHPDLFPDDAFAAHGRQALLLKNAGHYCIEEKPMEFCMVLKNFLDGKKSAYEHVLHVTSRN
ncbi:Alpha/Beta hydrolase protein [Phlyctochytrium arcticum]|nr:Alpha/Beta hydrolase protein [Phlyctochytrium arcticum]